MVWQGTNYSFLNHFNNRGNQSDTVTTTGSMLPTILQKFGWFCSFLNRS